MRWVGEVGVQSINNPVVCRDETRSNLTHEWQPPFNFVQKENGGRPWALIGGTTTTPWHHVSLWSPTSDPNTQEAVLCAVHTRTRARVVSS